MEPKYPDLCAVPALCKEAECGEHLGFYVNENNASNAEKAHIKHSHPELVPDKKPKSKPKKQKTRKYTFYTVECKCGWTPEHDIKEELIAHAEFANHLKGSPDCQDHIRKAKFSKYKKEVEVG